MHKSVPINRLRPNPFRNLDRYPVDREKVGQLRESYRSTGFWDNLVGREVNGGVEIAFGHHRLIALQEEYGEASCKPVGIAIQNLDDAAILKIMAVKNLENGANAKVAVETVRSIVEAFAAGRIKLPPVPKKTPTTALRAAPYFAPVGNDKLGGTNHLYTAETLAAFLGGVPKAVLNVALDTLAAQELKIVDEGDTEGLTCEQARVVLAGAKKIRGSFDFAASRQGRPEKQKQVRETGEALAKRFVKDATRKMKAGAGVREAEALADQIQLPKPKEIPDIETFADRTIVLLNRVLEDEDKLKQRLKALVRFRADISPRMQPQLLGALKNLADRVMAVHRKF